MLSRHETSIKKNSLRKQYIPNMASIRTIFLFLWTAATGTKRKSRQRKNRSIYVCGQPDTSVAGARAVHFAKIGHRSVSAAVPHRISLLMVPVTHILLPAWPCFVTGHCGVFFRWQIEPHYCTICRFTDVAERTVSVKPPSLSMQFT